MSEPSYHETAEGRRIAFHKTDGKGPGVIFLGGFKSDMEGTKAIALEDWAKARAGANSSTAASVTGRRMHVL